MHKREATVLTFRRSSPATQPELVWGKETARDCSGGKTATLLEDPPIMQTRYEPVRYSLYIT